MYQYILWYITLGICQSNKNCWAPEFDKSFLSSLMRGSWRPFINSPARSPFFYEIFPLSVFFSLLITLDTFVQTFPHPVSCILILYLCLYARTVSVSLNLLLEFFPTRLAVALINWN